MKRKILIVLLAATLLLTACGNGNSEQSVNNSEVDNVVEISEETSKSAIEALSDEERSIFEALIIASDIFYTPQSIKLLSVQNLMDDDVIIGGKLYNRDYNGPRCLIKISGDNRVGGNVNKEYILWTSDWYGKDWSPNNSDSVNYLLFQKGNIVENNHDNKKYAGEPHDFENVSVKNLNLALTEYWEELGLI